MQKTKSLNIQDQLTHTLHLIIPTINIGKLKQILKYAYNISLRFKLSKNF